MILVHSRRRCISFRFFNFLTGFTSLPSTVWLNELVNTVLFTFLHVFAFYYCFLFFMDFEEIHLESVDSLFLPGSVVRNQIQDGLEYSNIHFFEWGLRKMVVVLKFPAVLYFKGTLFVECAFGSVDIHGYNLVPNDCGPHIVLSGYGESAKCISSNIYETSFNEESMKKELFFRGIGELTLSTKFQFCTNLSVLIFSKCDTPVIDLIQSSFSKQLPWFKRFFHRGHLYFPKAEEWFNCHFDVYSGNRIPQKMKYHSNLHMLTQNILEIKRSRVLICGAKGTGKSTNLQFLINRLLKKHKAVLFIDFDIGQPEFTIPGCVSVVLVNEALLSPSFFHLQKPIRSIILCDVNPEVCCNKYIEAIEELSGFCNNLEKKKMLIDIPWLINTMGYVKGFGLTYIWKIISTFKVTQVVQMLNVMDPNPHFHGFPFTPEYFIKNIYWKPTGHQFPFCYELATIPPWNSKNMGITSPKILREIKVLSYMMMKRSELSIKKISLKHKSKKEVEYFQSNKVVALCTPWHGSKMMNCFGYGIILERKNEALIFVTPLSEKDMKMNIDIFVIEVGIDSDLLQKLNIFKSSLTKGNVIVNLKKNRTF